MANKQGLEHGKNDAQNNQAKLGLDNWFNTSTVVAQLYYIQQYRLHWRIIVKQQNIFARGRYPTALKQQHICRLSTLTLRKSNYKSSVLIVRLLLLLSKSDILSTVILYFQGFFGSTLRLVYLKVECIFYTCTCIHHVFIFPYWFIHTLLSL